MSTMALKYKVLLFNGRSDFMLWQSTIQDYLVHQGLDITLKDEKPSSMKAENWSTIRRKVFCVLEENKASYGKK